MLYWFQKFVTLYRRQGSRPSPWKRNAEKQNGCLARPYKAVKRREPKSKGEKERYKHLNAQFQRIARRDKKAFFSDQCKEIEENNRMGKTRDLFQRRQWHPTPVLLPGKSHGLRSLVGYSAWGRKDSDRTERLHFPGYLALGEWSHHCDYLGPEDLFCIDGGAW